MYIFYLWAQLIYPKENDFLKPWLKGVDVAWLKCFLESDFGTCKGMIAVGLSLTQQQEASWELFIFEPYKNILGKLVNCPMSFQQQ